MFFLFLAGSALGLAQDTEALRNLSRIDRDAARTGSDDRLYSSGTRALDANRWDDAVKAFAEAASRKSSHADGALYWKAYAENRLGQRDTALATIAALKRDYASSRWLNDAQALEVEIKQQSGKPVSPDSESNEDLKMLALNGILHSDPDQAIPIIEKLLKSNNSPKLKERALFVLSQSSSARAQQILTDVAKGGSNPDLQSKAIHYIAISGNKDARQQLLSIYSPSSDINVKKQIVHSLGIMPAAQSGDALVSIYNSDQDQSVKREAANGLFIQQNVKGLIDLARKENNLAMKQELVQKLSIMRSKEATAYLMEILQK
jgi:hypothetical protein